MCSIGWMDGWMVVNYYRITQTIVQKPTMEEDRGRRLEYISKASTKRQHNMAHEAAGNPARIRLLLHSMSVSPVEGKKK